MAKEEKSNFKEDVDYNALLIAFQKLNNVAPSEIRPDISLIVNGYQSITSDPSKMTTTELGIANSQLKVSNYIARNCPNY